MSIYFITIINIRDQIYLSLYTLYTLVYYTNLIFIMLVTTEKGYTVVKLYNTSQLM